MQSEMTRGAMRGLFALLVTLGSALVGRAYVTYLHATPFPPESAKVVPFIWLLAALIGLILALRALRFGPWKRRAALVLAPGVLGVLLALPNIAYAALYMFGAMLGG